MPRRVGLWVLLLTMLASQWSVWAFGAERIFHRVGTDDPATIDPHKVSLPGEQLVVLDLFMSLTTPGMTGRPIAGSAESWTLSADGRTYDFKLRSNLKWSDGQRITSEDWVYSFRRMLDPTTAFPLASRLFPIRNARAVAMGKLPVSALGVAAPDARTVRIELENPTPYFTDVIAAAAMPVQRHVIEKHGNEWLRPENFVSNGPFVLQEWRPNAYVRARANPHFWGADNLKLDGVVHYPLGNPGTLVRRFNAGELDLVMVVPPERTEELRSQHGESLRLGRGIANEVIVFITRSASSDTTFQLFWRQR